MSHAYIPSIPPFARNTPRHRRDLPPFIDLTIADVQNWARCSRYGWSTCTSNVCPRHQPVAYSEMMARHADD